MAHLRYFYIALCLLGLTVFAHASFDLDIDDDGKTEALTDGLLVIRHLFGFSGDSLNANATATDANRSDAASIETHLVDNKSSLDVDGDGSVEALTDGLLIIRELFGFSGDSLITGAASGSGTRVTGDSVVDYLKTIKDTDNDGYLDSVDAFVTDASEWVDTDSDGTGNNSDTDDDGDGVVDISDTFPLDSTESLDTDSDGTGNNADTDDDDDGLSDEEEASIGSDPLLVDTDADGVNDSTDVFPVDGSETIDTDSDGTGNNADTDDDGDGVADSSDAFPLNSSETLDTDSDGTGNNADTDDDGDGILDFYDIFPMDATKTIKVPAWDGFLISEEDPDSAMWVDGEYRRLTPSERSRIRTKSSKENFSRENYGLLFHRNIGFVEAVLEGPEASADAESWSFAVSDTMASGDFNGDGLPDVMVGHWLGKPASTWKPLIPVLVLVNQGNGRLEVDPCIFEDCKVPTAREMYLPKIVDFNGDGVDDFITLPTHDLSSPLLLLSSHEGLQDRSDSFAKTLAEFQFENANLNGHTFSVGDLNADGTLDLYVPDYIRNVEAPCSSTRPGCMGLTLLNDGKGNFSLGSTDFPFTGNVWGSDIHDFDDDGYGDILISLDDIDKNHIFFDEKHWKTESAMIMFGNSGGDYKQDIVYLPESPLGKNFIGLEFHLDDLDGDGLTDIMAIHTGDIQSQADFSGYYGGLAIQVLKNTGNRSFSDITGSFVDRSRLESLPLDRDGQALPSYYQYMDIDGDGDKDLWPISGQYGRVYYLREEDKFILAGSGGSVLDYRGTEGNCEYGCASTFYLGLAIDINQDGLVDFLQIEAGEGKNDGWYVSQLMTIKSPF